MTQFDATYENQMSSDAPKTSGMAIGSLVCSLIFCCPITTILGIILGIASIATIGSNPMKKGMGLALAGILIGLVATGLQGYVGVVGYGYVKEAMELVESGPENALAAASDGNFDEFRAYFYGDGVQATDDEITAFIGELETRFGEFQEAMVAQADVEPRPGQPDIVMPYDLVFADDTVRCAIKIIFSDPDAGRNWVCKFAWIEVADPELRNVSFPANADTSEAASILEDTSGGGSSDGAETDNGDTSGDASAENGSEAGSDQP